MAKPIEPAFAVDDDPDEYAALLRRIHAATMLGRHSPATPRPLIAESWRRLGGHHAPSPTSTPGLVQTSLLDKASQQRLLAICQPLFSGLDQVLREATALLVLADNNGVVIKQFGSPEMLTRARAIGFVEGACWSERAVGTNGIGTALVARHPVQIHGAEHYRPDQHEWDCAAAPIRDPRTQQIMGVINLSAPVAAASPLGVALVTTLARAATATLHAEHLESLTALRNAARSTTVSLSNGPLDWVLVDDAGWVADQSAHGPALKRVSLPSDLRAGPCWIEQVGQVTANPSSDGWLLSRYSEAAEPGWHVTLHLGEGWGAWIDLGPTAGAPPTPLSPRRAQILEHLARSAEGCSARELAVAVYGRSDQVGTMRAEMTRIRKILPGLVRSNPYRLAANVEVVGSLK